MFKPIARERKDLMDYNNCYCNNNNSYNSNNVFLVLFPFCSGETFLHYGLWDQVRVDHGKELYLMLFVHKVLKTVSEEQYKAAICADTVKTSTEVMAKVSEGLCGGAN